jgi:hypothetical protein
MLLPWRLLPRIARIARIALIALIAALGFGLAWLSRRSAAPS